MATGSRGSSLGEQVGMHVCIIDFANYPFIRRFAAYLNEQTSCAYLYHPGFMSPNQGQKESAPWEHPVSTGSAFAKQNLVKRFFQERAWAKAAIDVLDVLSPSLVVVANTPLEVLAVIQKWCHRNGTPFVYWLQDVHSYAIAGALRKKLPIAGGAIVRYYRRLEGRLLTASDRVLLIADDHHAVLADLGVPLTRARVLPNWSTVEDLPLARVDEGISRNEQAWRAEHGLVGKRLLMYSGTLGMKHDPTLFADLADALADDPAVAVVVISSGPQADWLAALAVERGLGNLYVLPFVDYSMVPTTLRAAEVMLAILEPDAARFSVPSKILTYACAGRPVVVAMSPDNAAARLITEVGFGTVTPPGDTAAFIKAVRHLLEHRSDASELGLRGRAYAEANFPMPVIEKRFTEMMAGLTSRP